MNLVENSTNFNDNYLRLISLFPDSTSYLSISEYNEEAMDLKDLNTQLDNISTFLSLESTDAEIFKPLERLKVSLKVDLSYRRICLLSFLRILIYSPYSTEGNFSMKMQRRA